MNSYSNWAIPVSFSDQNFNAIPVPAHVSRGYYSEFDKSKSFDYEFLIT